MSAEQEEFESARNDEFQLSRAVLSVLSEGAVPSEKLLGLWQNAASRTDEALDVLAVELLGGVA